MLPIALLAAFALSMFQDTGPRISGYIRSSYRHVAGVWSPRAVEKIRSVTAVAMSPDGAHVAYALSVPRIAGTDEDGAAWSELHVLDTADGSERTFVGGHVNVGALEWLHDGSAIAFLAKRDGDKQTSLYTIPLAGGESKKRVEFDTSISAFSLSPDDKRVAFVAPKAEDPARKKLVEKGFKQTVYEEDQPLSKVWIGDMTEPATKSRELPVDGHVYQVHWSPIDNRLAITVAPTALVDDEYMKQKVRVIGAEDGAEIRRIDNPGKLGEIAWSPDGKWIAGISARDIHDPAAGRLVVWNSGLDTSLPAIISPLPDDWAADVMDFRFIDETAVLVVVHRGVEATLEKVGFWFKSKEGDPRSTEVRLAEYKTIQAAGIAIFTGISLSTDGQHAALVASSPDHPPEVYTMSHGDTAAVRRTDSNPWTKDMKLAEQEVVHWKARDGVELDGVLVHALMESAAQKTPLVLCVHGGPESHESNGWMTNYSRPGEMASGVGIATFYPNYRGSTGRGVAFSKLSQGDAGGKEFDDLIDAVDWLVANKNIDKDKVGITGGSYGGYATAWCCTKYSDRFAAGVMFVGISDKIGKIGSTDIPEEDFLVHSLHRPWDKLDFFRERSPITYADQCKTPLLIMGGKDDQRVDPSQSKAMYRWLKLRGHAPVRLVQYPGEQHGNRKACARFDYSVRMLDWLDHYLNHKGDDEPKWDVDYNEFEPKEPSHDAADMKSNQVEPKKSKTEKAGAGQGR